MTLSRGPGGVANEVEISGATSGWGEVTIRRRGERAERTLQMIFL